MGNVPALDDRDGEIAYQATFGHDLVDHVHDPTEENVVGGANGLGMRELYVHVFDVKYQYTLPLATPAAALMSAIVVPA